MTVLDRYPLAPAEGVVFEAWRLRALCRGQTEINKKIKNKDAPAGQPNAGVRGAEVAVTAGGPTSAPPRPRCITCKGWLTRGDDRCRSCADPSHLSRMIVGMEETPNPQASPSFDPQGSSDGVGA